MCSPDSVPWYVCVCVCVYVCVYTRHPDAIDSDSNCISVSLFHSVGLHATKSVCERCIFMKCLP